MNKKKLIPGLKVIDSKLFRDNRGFFYELTNKKTLKVSNIKKNFVQDNLSYSKYGVVRGLHFQKDNNAQGKLITVLKGEIFDVAVDMRKNSIYYGKYSSIILSEKNKKKFWIPRGFAHGFLVLSNCALVLYKTDNFYNKKNEVCILWNDKTLNINWPNTKKIIISKKDKKGLKFHEVNSQY